MSSAKVSFLLAILFTITFSSAFSQEREERFLKGLGLTSLLYPTANKLFLPSSNYCGHPDNCPIHHCRVDDTVILGYCCGCARVSDSVPVRCPPFLTCPPTPQPLCSQYDWMMDCCC